MASARGGRSLVTELRSSDTTSTNSTLDVVIKTSGVTLQDSGTLLTDLPLDILIQIMARLHPRDVRSLSQTTKDFRSYLMSRTSRATVWTPALKSLEYIDIPKCPEKMSEPRFVHILFSATCEECGDLGHALNLYTFNALVCPECIPKRYAPLRVLVKGNPLPWGPRELADMVHCLDGELWTAVFAREGDDPKEREDEALRAYHIESIASLQMRWSASQQDDNAKNNLALEAKREFMEQKDCDVLCRNFIVYELERVEGAEMIREMLRKEDRGEEEVMRDDREDKLKERLIAMGFRLEVQTFFAPWNEARTVDPSVHYKLYQENFREQTAELTDDEWDNIEQEMVDIMLEERRLYEISPRVFHMSELIDYIFKPAFAAFAFSQPPNTVLPTPKEVALMPEWVAALSTGSSAKRPTPALVAAAVAAMPAFCDGVREWRTEQVLRIVRWSETYRGREAEATPDVLTLASTIFRCSLCNDRMTYPNVLVHGCNYVEISMESRQRFKSFSIPDTARVIKPLDEDWGTRPLATLNEKAIAASRDANLALGEGSFWNYIDNIHYDDVGHEHMLNMLSALRMDQRTTAKELEERQPYVEGLCQCFKTAASPSNSDSEPKKVMRWMKAIQSSRAHEKPEKRKNWFAKPTKAYLALVADAEAIRRSTHSVQACIWAHGGNDRTRLSERIYAGEEGKRASLSELSMIRHPGGVEAAREYVEGRTLEAFAHLEDEEPLKMTVRRSSRKKGNGAVPA